MNKMRKNKVGSRKPEVGRVVTYFGLRSSFFGLLIHKLKLIGVASVLLYLVGCQPAPQNTFAKNRRENTGKNGFSYPWRYYRYHLHFW